MLIPSARGCPTEKSSHCHNARTVEHVDDVVAGIPISAVNREPKPIARLRFMDGASLTPFPHTGPPGQNMQHLKCWLEAPRSTG